MPFMRPAESTKSPRKGRISGLLLLCLLLLYGQSVDLVHSHGDDLRQQYDCEICTKFGGNDDAVSNGKQTLPLPRVPRPDVEPAARLDSPPLLSFRARAPPLVHS